MCACVCVCVCVCVCLSPYKICIYISWLTVIEGDLKTLFQITTTLIYRGGPNSFPRIASLSLDPYLIILSIKHGGIKYYFLSFGDDSTIGENSNYYIN